MICCFPNVYPDELAYSWFARYKVRSGHISYSGAARDLFEMPTVKPNIEFLSPLSEEALHIISQYMPLNELILKHTMFPHYARFLPLERRKDALDLMLQMNKTYVDALFLKKGHTMQKRFLRYCPICSALDREKYGETYWHRLHQIPEISDCPIHNSHLLSSTIEITSKDSPSLIAAESVIPSASDIIMEKNSKKSGVNQYIKNVFESDLNMESNTPIGKFLHSKLEYTPYVTTRGEQRNMKLLFSSFSQFYTSLPDNPIQEQWQLGKIFQGSRLNTYDICLVGYFLNIPVEELVNMSPLPDKPQYQIFDERILDLHKKGFNYRKIAKIMGASYYSVKFIGEHYQPNYTLWLKSTQD